MVATARRYLAVLALVLALLAGLVGWTVRMNTLPLVPHHIGAHSSRVLADDPPMYCPPPPRTC